MQLLDGWRDYHYSISMVFHCIFGCSFGRDLKCRVYKLYIGVDKQNA